VRVRLEDRRGPGTGEFAELISEHCSLAGHVTTRGPIGAGPNSPLAYS
jgi:hypothetical protein